MEQNRGPGGNWGTRPQARQHTRQQDIGFIKDLDAELLRIIAKRTAVLEKLKDKGRLPALVEKELRVAWESRAHNQSRDNRLARDMFSLLQVLEPGLRDKEQDWFNLAPSTAPVEINLHCPADAFWVRCHMAVAAASGQAMTLTDVALGDTTIECCKALNQLGASLWWESPQLIHHRAAKGLPGGLDKVVHVGDDEFNLWLVLALSLGQVNQIKFTGGKSAHIAGLAEIKSWLPVLGARLSGIVPAQDGLPLRLESSGLMPRQVDLPATLPQRFVAALFLAAPFWAEPVQFRLERLDELPYAVTVFLSDNGAQIKVNNDNGGQQVTIKPAVPRLPAQPPLPPELMITANLLALPAFCGGHSSLKGAYQLAGPNLAIIEQLLTQAGLALNREADCMSSQRVAERAGTAFSPELIASVLADLPSLFPLLTVLAAHQAQQHGSCALDLPLDLDPDLAAMLESFLNQLDLTYDQDSRAVIRQVGHKTAAWLSPDVWWAMAFGWAAFFRPNIHLVNPGVVTSDFPPFWNVYNTLPKPESMRKAREEHNDVKPVRRRIIAPGAYFTPPEKPAGDSD